VQPAGSDEAEPAPATAAKSSYRRSLAWSPPSSGSSDDEAAESIMDEPIVTAEERDALMDGPAVAGGITEDEAWAEIEAELNCDESDEPIVLTAEDVPNWGEVRARVARTRRPPRRILDAA
jgi:hypothetical protein